MFVSEKGKHWQLFDQFHHSCLLSGFGVCANVYHFPLICQMDGWMDGSRLIPATVLRDFTLICVSHECMMFMTLPVWSAARLVRNSVLCTAACSRVLQKHLVLFMKGDRHVMMCHQYDPACFISYLLSGKNGWCCAIRSDTVLQSSTQLRGSQ